MSILSRIASFLNLGRQDREIARAIAELSAYSDRELSELGIRRADIREAVLYGRPGIDAPLPANDDDLPRQHAAPRLVSVGSR
jgi:uncharacterized protein YjiS (DUF1127 family)